MRKQGNLVVIIFVCLVIVLMGVFCSVQGDTVQNGILTSLIIPGADGNVGDLLYARGNGLYGWTSTAPSFVGGSITADCVMANGKYIESDTTVAHTSGLALRDTTAAAYVPIVLMTNGTTNGTNAVTFGYSSVPMTIASYGGLNVSAAGAVTGVSTMSMSDNLSIANGKSIKVGDNTAGHAITITARDTTNNADRNMLTVTNGTVSGTSGTLTGILGNAYSNLALTSTGFNVDTSGNVSGVATLTYASGVVANMTIVTVSNAEVRTLYSSPKVLVSGVAGSVIDVISVDIFSIGGATGWNSTANAIGVYLNNAGTLTACTGTVGQSTALSTGVSTNLVTKLIPAAISGATSANTVAKDVVLSCASADPTTGTGTLKVAISYRVVPTGF